MNKSCIPFGKIIQHVCYCVVIVIILSSCKTTSSFNFQGLEAPSILLPSDVKTIGFVDRNMNFNIDTISGYYRLNDLVLRDTSDYDTIMADNCYLGLEENLSELIAIDSVNKVRLPKRQFTGERTYDPLKWEVVDSICEKTGSDILISLEDLQIFNRYSVVSGETSYGITDINYFAVWRIYDPLYEKYIDERAIVDSLYTDVESYSYRTIVEELLPKRNDIMRDVSYDIGNNYAKLLSPEWINMSREYFVAGDKRFAVAEYYMEVGDWDKSIDVYKQVTNESDPKIAARACYNLAIAYEQKDDYKVAEEWLAKSISNYKKLSSLPGEFELVKAYAISLSKRTENNEKLDLFFGKEQKN
ncbi:DUF6340 family protein [Ancylomarina longa]|uniref:Tetratricopeptide repeat protein n=1 Tax=Ancylomarina longa TaxID=2487017 RepID=A0A434AZ48_9BACT|nr:DUF6340 family protein [Ancylomarina longa]RUT79899.1 tetratricopeptide repeat protein [Ancylomarina longa]